MACWFSGKVVFVNTSTFELHEQISSIFLGRSTWLFISKLVQKVGFVGTTIHFFESRNQIFGSPETHSIKDLGVTLQDDGKYDLHIHEKVSKASQICGWVMRVFETRERTLMLTLYKALTLPHMDYCSLIWSPSSATLTQKIERVQRLSTRNISGFRHLSYWDRLSSLKLYSIERRMERYQIIYLLSAYMN